MKWLGEVWHWLSLSKKGNGERYQVPLLAFYWSGGPIRPHEIEWISAEGAFIRAKDLWGVGTRVQIRLQEREEDDASDEVNRSYALECMIVRRSKEGLEVRFLFDNRRQQRHFKEFLKAVSKPKPAVSYAGNSRAGHSLVEFALLIPLLFVLIVNAVNFGGFFYAWITVANAARTGAQYRILGGATVSSPSSPNSTQVYNVVRQDLSSLHNISSLGVRVCTNNNGTIACNSTGSGSYANPPADTRTEANLFVMAWVDVQYTFQPLIPAFHFPGLGIHGTLPPTTIRRQAVMRVMQ